MTHRLFLLVLVAALAGGCAFKSRGGGSSAYDYSEYETYDQAHGAP